MEAIQKGATHLLFLDDDNPVPPDTLIKLLEDDKDIVIAPILSRNPNKN
jgi:GT2 family glycosyltransferase